LKATIARSFTNSDERLDASTQDRQGFGVPRQIPTLAADRSRSENLP
jgi:hypothetical protein